jgi:hypothetical protein
MGEGGEGGRVVVLFCVQDGGCWVLLHVALRLSSATVKCPKRHCWGLLSELV